MGIEGLKKKCKKYSHLLVAFMWFVVFLLDFVLNLSLMGNQKIIPPTTLTYLQEERQRKEQKNINKGTLLDLA